MHQVNVQRSLLERQYATACNYFIKIAITVTRELSLIITMLHLPFYPQLANLAKLRSVNTYKNVKLTCERVRTCWFVQVYGDVLVCMASSSSVLLFSREAN